MIIQMEGAVILQILNPSIQDLDHIKESIQGLSATGEQKQANEKILEPAELSLHLHFVARDLLAQTVVGFLKQVIDFAVRTVLLPKDNKRQ